jgi:N-acetylmuramoyl-L-alanine amidase/uncharacterized protein YgiM (DUF1202 family)
MKKFLLVVLVLIFLFVTLPANAQSRFSLISVTGSSVNVRKGPGLSYSVEYQVSKGTILELLSKKYSSSGDLWYRVYDFNNNKIVFIASWLTENSGVSITGRDADFTAEVTADVLNARIGPGTAFKVIDVLSLGDRVHVTRVISRSDGQDWYRYKKNGKYFYIAGWYTKKIAPEKTDANDNSSTASEKTNTTAVANYYINIRKGPSLDYEKIGLVSKGDSLSVIGVAKNDSGETWIQVQYKGSVGWCYSPLFSIAKIPEIDFSPIGGKGSAIDYVNLRLGPSTEYEIKKILPKGSICDVVGIAKNSKGEIWYEVNTGSKGWIRSDLITLKSAKKASISNITWRISSHGIDVLIYGKDLRKPSISTLENPIRLNLEFDNTILSKEKNALSINVLPIVRVRFDQKGFNTNVIVDLTDRVPFKGNFENGNFVLNLELPKKGEKKVELSGSEVYAPVVNYENMEFIELGSILGVFNGRISTSNDDIHITLLDKNITVPKKDTIEKDGEVYIALTALADNFNVSILDTGKTIYIDPILMSFSLKNEEENYLFSLPPKVKKLNDGYVIFADAGKFADKLDFNKRNIDTFPEIKVGSKDDQIVVSNRTIVVKKSVIKNGILSGKVIVIDPGHGSYSGPYLDTGATGPTGVKEGAVVLEIAKRLKKILENEGATVILTHDTLDDPNNPTLAQRCAIANSSGGDLFMSIHLNASVSPDAHGTETYYWHSDSLRFAQDIQNALVDELGTTNRGVKRDYLYVCRNVTTMPAILTEVVFVSNPHEEGLCKEPTFLDKVAKALKDGIISYFANGG